MKSSTFDSVKFDELYLGREDQVWDKRRTFRVELNSEIKICVIHVCTPWPRYQNI